LDPYPNSRFCVLHTPFPEDEKSEEYQKILNLKNRKVHEKIQSGNFDFRGVIIEEFKFTGELRIQGDLLFEFATIKRGVLCSHITIEGSAIFRGAKIGYVWFRNAVIGIQAVFDCATIEGEADFIKAKIGGYASFFGATIKKEVWFNDAKIGESALFDSVTIERNAYFFNTIIKKDAIFSGATIMGESNFFQIVIGGNTNFKDAVLKNDVEFGYATIGGNASFDGATIGGKASFEGVKIDGSVDFRSVTIKSDANLCGATIGNSIDLAKATIQGDIILKEDSDNFGMIKGDINLLITKILGNLLFTNSFFVDLHAREQINRYAKKLCEERGQKHDADNYFFKEMVYRREQKNWHESKGKPIKERVIKSIRYWIEWPLKNLFFYGVHPEYSFIILISVIGVFAIIYWLGSMVDTSNFSACLYFSITNAMTPGYGGLYPKSGWPQYVASIEAIFGTFMWASFIAILARKFSR